MTEQSKIMVGADPEVFLADSSGKIVPVCGLVGGTKDSPKEYTRLKVREGDVGKFAYQEDGAAFEWNIPASDSAEGFADNIRRMQNSMRSLVGDKGYSLRYVVGASFTEDQFAKFPQLNVLGCEPDYDAYGSAGTPSIRPPFAPSSMGMTRYAGGHLHLSYDTKAPNAPPAHIMAKLIDFFVGLPLSKLDKQSMRRNFYGKPGLYRPKPYGIEYRTLSNFWLNPAYPDLPHYIAQTLIELATAARATPDLLASLYHSIDWYAVKTHIQYENSTSAYSTWRTHTSATRVPTRGSANLWEMVAAYKPVAA